MKQLIWSQYLRFPYSTLHAFWTPDGFHPNTRGHRVLSDLLTSYLSTRICSIGGGVSSTVQATSSSSSLSDTVRLSNHTHHWNTTDEDIQYGPALHLDDLKNETYHFILPKPLSVPPIPFNLPHSQVFDPMSDSDSANSIQVGSPNPFCADSNDPNSPLNPREREGWEPLVWKDEKHFWVSSTPGARIIVDIAVSEGL
jgi:hypothetical protein